MNIKNNGIKEGNVAKTDGSSKKRTATISKGEKENEVLPIDEAIIFRPGKEDTQKSLKKIFNPIKQQIYSLVEYINVVEKKKDVNGINELTFFTEYFNTVKYHCDFYIKYYSSKGK
jgi:hypothetical protein